ncbi:hypothetical protein ILYODFUR_038414 [Ilyodon furcidens]|uniref:Uncharacterized protein n=1 Tax=Ilyodon furcidens TaxID=33524 RepID=A0ABV0UZK6_9TELE
MYTFSTSSTNIVVRHTIFYCCQESIVYPEKDVLPGQEGLLYPVFALKKFLPITLRVQLVKFIIYKFGGYAKRGSEKNTDKKQKQGSAGREGEKMHVFHHEKEKK